MYDGRSERPVRQATNGGLNQAVTAITETIPMEGEQRYSEEAIPPRLTEADNACYSGEERCIDGSDVKSAYNMYNFRNFSVEKMNYGYIVTVGCHKFAIESKERLAGLLSTYVLDPNRVEQTWWKDGIV